MPRSACCCIKTVVTVILKYSIKIELKTVLKTELKIRLKTLTI